VRMMHRNASMNKITPQPLRKYKYGDKSMLFPSHLKSWSVWILFRMLEAFLFQKLDEMNTLVLKLHEKSSVATQIINIILIQVKGHER
jgi:hypothetical protein